ncbi:MAG: hypothetical protein KBF67_07520, partial [Flavobacteriales bacterium]|nr:hypothetical protein [Flavobacteriales bacterium]
MTQISQINADNALSGICISSVTSATSVDPTSFPLWIVARRPVCRRQARKGTFSADDTDDADKCR